MCFRRKHFSRYELIFSGHTYHSKNIMFLCLLNQQDIQAMGWFKILPHWSISPSVFLSLPRATVCVLLCAALK